MSAAHGQRGSAGASLMYLIAARVVELFARATKFIIENGGPDQIAAATRYAKGE
ncbi:MAG TPA: hypothetical protein VG246_08795 [Acidimicrobiales bacterium]|nr:hypothetical protein [Acidimicrobiales bacterium]